MTTYIQKREKKKVTTVEEFSTLFMARQKLNKYREKDPSGKYYLSTRACRAWRESRNIS